MENSLEIKFPWLYNNKNKLINILTEKSENKQLKQTFPGFCYNLNKNITFQQDVENLLKVYSNHQTLLNTLPLEIIYHIISEMWKIIKKSFKFNIKDATINYKGNLYDLFVLREPTGIQGDTGPTGCSYCEIDNKIKNSNPSLFKKILRCSSDLEKLKEITKIYDIDARIVISTTPKLVTETVLTYLIRRYFLRNDHSCLKSIQNLLTFGFKLYNVDTKFYKMAFLKEDLNFINVIKGYMVLNSDFMKECYDKSTEKMKDIILDIHCDKTCHVPYLRFGNACLFANMEIIRKEFMSVLNPDDIEKGLLLFSTRENLSKRNVHEFIWMISKHLINIGKFLNKTIFQRNCSISFIKGVYDFLREEDKYDENGNYLLYKKIEYFDELIELGLDINHFKENIIGHNFRNYVDEKRFENICKMIKNHGHKIDPIPNLKPYKLKYSDQQREIIIYLIENLDSEKFLKKYPDISFLKVPDKIVEYYGFRIIPGLVKHYGYENVFNYFKDNENDNFGQHLKECALEINKAMRRKWSPTNHIII